MSQPESGSEQPSPARPPGLPLQSTESSTDPGRSQPYESLYRGLDGGRPSSHRTTARHFEPSLNPPDGQAESGDTYGWLYRSEPEPVQQADAATAATTTGPALTEPVAAPPVVPPTLQSAAARPPQPPKLSSRRRLAVVTLLIALVLVLAGAGFLAVRVLRSDNSGNRSQAVSRQPAASTPAVSVRPSLRPTTGPYQGAVVPLIPQKLVVDCQAPASRDGAGKPVSYGPSSAFDKNLTTAWRCNGSGRNRHLVFSFAASTKVAQLGLVNGYAKIDPRTTENRYGEYRRITAVTWTFPNGVAFQQQLRDGDEAVQIIRIPTQVTGQLTLTIDKTTQPGQRAKTRDAVLISEVAIAGPRG